MEDCSGIPVEYLSIFEVYDPSTDKWTSLPPMPTPRTDLSLAVIDSKVYAVGGCGGDGAVQNAKSCDPLSSVEVYSPSTQAWTSLDSLASPRHGFNLAVYGSQLIAAGGSSSVGIDTASVAKNLTKTVDVCDLSYGNSWSRITAMSEPREGLVTGNLLVGISMLLISGEGADTTFTDTNEYLALMCSPAPPVHKSALDKFIHGLSC